VNQTDQNYFIKPYLKGEIGKCAVLAITAHIWPISVQQK